MERQNNNLLPAVTAYQRIDGPGSSLDLREFQQALWRLPQAPPDSSDPALAWTRTLPRTVAITIDTGTKSRKLKKPTTMPLCKQNRKDQHYFDLLLWTGGGHSETGKSTDSLSRDSWTQSWLYISVVQNIALLPLVNFPFMRGVANYPHHAVLHHKPTTYPT